MEWPKNLTHLEFGYNFDQPLHNDIKWPPGLTHLTFGYEFNQDIPVGCLPESLTHLVFEKECLFDQPILALPRNLTTLIFGQHFNQPLDELKWPPRLTHLRLGQNFNQPLTGDVLPSTLTNLTFQWYFDTDFDVKKITDNITLPPSLVSLSVGDRTIKLGESKRGDKVAKGPFQLKSDDYEIFDDEPVDIYEEMY